MAKGTSLYPNFDSLMGYLAKIKHFKSVARLSGYKSLIIYVALSDGGSFKRIANLKINISDADTLAREFELVRLVLSSGKREPLRDFPFFSRLLSLLRHVADEPNKKSPMEIMVYALGDSGKETYLTGKEMTADEKSAILNEARDIKRHFSGAAI